MSDLDAGGSYSVASIDKIDSVTGECVTMILLSDGRIMWRDSGRLRSVNARLNCEDGCAPQALRQFRDFALHKGYNGSTFINHMDDPVRGTHDD